MRREFPRSENPEPRHLPSFAPLLVHALPWIIKSSWESDLKRSSKKTSRKREHKARWNTLKRMQVKAGVVVGLLLVDVMKIFRWNVSIFCWGGGEVENPLPKYEQAKNKLLLSGGFKHFFKKITPI